MVGRQRCPGDQADRCLLTGTGRMEARRTDEVVSTMMHRLSPTGDGRSIIRVTQLPQPVRARFAGPLHERCRGGSVPIVWSTSAARQPRIAGRIRADLLRQLVRSKLERRHLLSAHGAAIFRVDQDYAGRIEVTVAALTDRTDSAPWPESRALLLLPTTQCRGGRVECMDTAART
jgi:hypothetical protein